MILDSAMGPPTYAVYPGIARAAQDNLTNVIYHLYILFVPVVILILRVRRARIRNWHTLATKLTSELVTLRVLLWTIVFCPLLYFLIYSPSYERFLIYATTLDNTFDQAEALFFSNFTALAYPAILAFAGIIITARRLLYTFAAVPPVIFAVYVHGKRNTVFMAILCVVVALLLSKRLSGIRFVVLSIPLFTCYFAFSEWYQANYRGYIVEEGRKYESLRLDWGRDGDTKMAVYTELYLEDQPILEYRLQSMLFNGLFFVPRTLWPEKPWPYSYYFTCRALGMPYGRLGWGLTTSSLGELIANMGWIGCLFGAISLTVLCRIGDRAQSVLLALMTTVVAMLSLMLTIGNYLPIIAVWLIVAAWDRWGRLVGRDQEIIRHLVTVRSVPDT